MNVLRVATALIATSMLLAGCGKEGTSSTAAPAATHAPETVAAMNRAVGLMGRFDFEDAAKAFDLIAKAPKSPPEALLNRAIATLNQSREGAQDAALAELAAFLAANPPAPLALRAKYCVGLCELYLGRAALAEPLFAEAADARAADPYAQYFAAQALEQQGEYAKALARYEAAVKADPMLKSALLGVQRCARKSGDEARADRALAEFEQLSANPRARSAEFKYTRMGELGMAVVIGDPPKPAPRAGEVFEAPRPLPLVGAADDVAWSTDVAQYAASVDLDHDGLLDVVITRGMMALNAEGSLEARTLYLRRTADGSFEPRTGHALASLGGPGVNSILFGDIDANGRTDAYLCRTDRNILLLQDADGSFRDATDAWKAGGRGGICNDGALADLDHDGDLDLFLLYREGANDLLANLGDGTYKSIAQEAGIVREERGPRSVIVGDFDYDRDADILVINETLPHQLLLNDRLWKWRDGTAPGISAEQLGDGAAAACIVEIADLPLRRGVFAASNYLRMPARVQEMTVNRSIELGVADADGDGRDDVFVFGADRISMFDEAGRHVRDLATPEGSVRTQLLTLEPQAGPHLISHRVGAAPLLWAPGGGRGAFVALGFSGRDDPSQSMRSNASGIGTTFAARTGTRWTGGEAFRRATGRSQSLAPVSIGVGDARGIDLVEIEWSDGVLQSEVELPAGVVHALAETQRQISSCPVLFAWNGRTHVFVSDLLGVGGIGYLLEPGVYSEPRPRETFVLPADALVAKPDGTLSITLAEPMEESCMLDGARLLAVDLPRGWEIAPDERLAIGGAPPTGEIVAWSGEWPALGNATLEKADLMALDPGALDPRFIGRLAGEQLIELGFNIEIDKMPDPWLVIDGWIEYPYCQTMFAAWQAGAKFRAPSLEARASDGSWVELIAEWGYPAGMPRRMAMPVPREQLPMGCTALRMRTNMEIYFDSVRLVSREALPMQSVACALKSARLAAPGFARRTTGPQRQPSYDRDAARPLWDCRFQRGLYTEFGDVSGLIARTDGAPVVFGPGEEVAIDFVSPPPAPEGFTRRYVLEVDGWCKDMDLFTRDGETIHPLPGTPIDAAAAELLRKTRIRPAGGH
ncbi:MAG: hypothetical protein RIS45_1229 [Planctomycetota bacterium]